MTEARGRSLRLFNWIDYISPKVLDSFETQTGIHVDQIFFHTEAEGATRLAAGERFDIALVTDYISESLREAGRLQPLDMERLPNWRHVTKELLRRPPHDSEADGHKYTVVLYFGTEGFAAQLEKVQRVRNTWEMLFDPALAGEISMLDESRSVLAPALFLEGDDANCTDAAVLREAAVRMSEQSRLVCTYDSDTPAQRIADGVSIVHCWNGDMGRALSLGARQVHFVLPREGYPLFLDSLCIPASAPNPDGAYLLLDYLYDPAIAAANADFSGYQPAPEAAVPLMRSLVQRSMRPTDEQLAAGTVLRNLGSVQNTYDSAYARIRGMRSL